MQIFLTDEYFMHKTPGQVTDVNTPTPGVTDVYKAPGTPGNKKFVVY